MKTEPVQQGRLFARLLSDIMIPPQFSAAIRAQGYDVAEVRALAQDIQRDDRAILAEATRQKRAVITCNYSDRNSNFCVIHEDWRMKNKQHFGILLIPQTQIASRLGRWDVRDRLLRFLNQRTADEFRDQLLWLPRE